MNQRNRTDKYDIDDLRSFEKNPPFWPRVIGFGILALAAVLLIAYSTFETGSIAMAFIAEQPLSPYLLTAVLLGAILLLVIVR